VKLLAKLPGSRALKSFYSLAHWAIPKSSVSAGAKDLANYFLSPERQTQYAKLIGMAPANRLATYDDPPLGALLKEDEFERFGYFCDFDYMSQNVQKWIGASISRSGHSSVARSERTAIVRSRHPFGR
jgi:ABC-type glycerol-3-phosphate transport system substrate-binding protein